MFLYNIGVGKHLPGKGLKLQELLEDINEKLSDYNIPVEKASICRPGLGSIYLFEIQWVQE